MDCLLEIYVQPSFLLKGPPVRCSVNVGGREGTCSLYSVIVFFTWVFLKLETLGR